MSVFTSNNTKFVLHVDDIVGQTENEKKRKAMKIHRQFAHAPYYKLEKLLKEAECTDKEFFVCVREVCEKCEICAKLKKPQNRPVVGFRMADEFNKVVCMDLKEFKSQSGKTSWILHMIDSATRYSAATFVTTKSKDVVVSKILMIWLRYFGAPKKLLSDNGGEFANDVLMEMNEKFGIVTKTTAGESPWMNGTCERHHTVLFESTIKTMEDCKCSPEMALAWAVCAKNSLYNEHGYSPNQLVFGWNLNLPCVLKDEPPALESTTSSEIVRAHLNALHSARQNYIKAESSERIKRALRHQTRTYVDTSFENGEQVYYRRGQKKEWKGPAKVIGQEGKIVLVRHGVAYYRCHPCQLRKCIESEASAQPKTAEMKAGKNVDSAIVYRAPDRIELEDESSDDTDDGGTPEAQNERQSSAMSHHQGDECTEETSEDSQISVEPTSGGDLERIQNTAKPNPKQHIEYELKDGSVCRATILSSQPKRGGKWGNWINIQNEGELQAMSVNWNDVLSWKEVEKPESVLVNEVDLMSQEVLDAKNREVQNLVEHDVYEAVKDLGQSKVSTRWVITEKEKDDNRVVKARLVARGFEEKVEARTDSPTCSRISLRLCWSMAATFRWEIRSLDVTSAVLQGNTIERDVFLEPPPEIKEEGVIWKLKRCIYGLADAPRAWYDKVVKEFVSLGAKKSLYDEALFLWHDNTRQLIGMNVIHVDDFIYCGTAEWETGVMNQIMRTFKISARHHGSFRYVGLNISRGQGGILVDQCAYVDGLKQIEIAADRIKDKESPLTDGEKKQVRSLGGQLLWAATQTRPDIAFDTCMSNNVGKFPKVRDIETINKCVKKARSADVKLFFPDLGSFTKFRIIAFSDASHANLPSGGSQGGMLVLLAGETNHVAPIVWQSKKLARVTKSPFAAEVMAQADAADTALLVANMVKEFIPVDTKVPVECRTDSRSICDHLKTCHIIEDSRVRIDVARLKEMVQLGEIEVKWVSKFEQLADPLTKAGATSKRLLEVLKSGRL